MNSLPLIERLKDYSHRILDLGALLESALRELTTGESVRPPPGKDSKGLGLFVYHVLETHPDWFPTVDDGDLHFALRIRNCCSHGDTMKARGGVTDAELQRACNYFTAAIHDLVPRLPESMIRDILDDPHAIDDTEPLCGIEKTADATHKLVKLAARLEGLLAHIDTLEQNPAYRRQKGEPRPSLKHRIDRHYLAHLSSFSNAALLEAAELSDKAKTQSLVYDDLKAATLTLAAAVKNIEQDLAIPEQPAPLPLEDCAELPQLEPSPSIPEATLEPASDIHGARTTLRKLLIGVLLIGIGMAVSFFLRDEPAPSPSAKTETTQAWLDDTERAIDELRKKVDLALEERPEETNVALGKLGDIEQKIDGALRMLKEYGSDLERMKRRVSTAAADPERLEEFEKALENAQQAQKAGKTLDGWIAEVQELRVAHDEEKKQLDALRRDRERNRTALLAELAKSRLPVGELTKKLFRLRRGRFPELEEEESQIEAVRRLLEMLDRRYDLLKEKVDSLGDDEEEVMGAVFPPPTFSLS